MGHVTLARWDNATLAPALRVAILQLRASVSLSSGVLHSAPCPEIYGGELVVHVARRIAAMGRFASAEVAGSDGAPTLRAATF